MESLEYIKINSRIKIDAFYIYSCYYNLVGGGRPD